MVRELEEAFFLEAALNADNLFVEAGGAATLAVEIEKLITSLEKTRNNYVNGVDRQMMDIVLDVDTYSSFRVYLDEVPQAPNVNTAVDQFGVYHGVRIYSSVYLPLGVKALIMAKGAVAQPVMSNPYGAERIPLSNAFAVELFYSYGTKVVTPDLIWVWKRQLAKPAPTLAAAILTIPAVADAVRFKIFDGATLKATINAVEGGDTTYNLALTVSGSGTHPITVIAVNNQEAFKESVASDVDNYVIA